MSRKIHMRPSAVKITLLLRQERAAEQVSLDYRGPDCGRNPGARSTDVVSCDHNLTNGRSHL